MYRVEFSSKAKKIIKKLPKQTSLRILNKFEEISQEPFRHLEHYEGYGYKFRIGEYRALIDVDFQNKVLKVRVLDKRGRVYKR